MSIITISEQLMDEYFDTVSDEEFLDTYNEVENSQGITVIEYLEQNAGV